MTDASSTRVRERVWVDKVDHEGPTPRLVERVAVEDGVTVAVVPGTEVDPDERAEIERRAARGEADANAD